MIISESWLRQWVPTRISSKELTQRLTMVGLEVGVVEAAGERVDGVVVGQITQIEKHPDADRLKVCTVDIAEKDELNIVCGAPNAEDGLKVAVATVGTKLPNGLKIKKSRIRGVESHGMLCSLAELGLADDSYGIVALESSARNGERFDKHFDLEDKLIEIDLTPNRGDCMSLKGIARELAAATRTKVREQAIPGISPSHKNRIDIELAQPNDCPRYVGRIIKAVNPRAQSPAWLCEKLRRCGLRSVSPIVDVTNYVMMELGQPMHAFDFDKLDGGIVIRRARDKEKLKLLDGTNVNLDEQHLVIADESRAIALAGIMGGESTSITDTTTSIFLESAFFSPQAVIGRARKLGLHTDAAQRYERGVDPTIQKVAVERATSLLLEITGGEPGPVIESVHRPSLPKRTAATLRKQRLERMIGRSYTDSRVVDVLTRLGMKVTENANGWRVTPPAWRFDVQYEHDLVEEVARVVGYDSITPRQPKVVANQQLRKEQVLADDRIDNCLIDRGYRETVTYSFVDPTIQEALFPVEKAIKLANPIASNLSDMRLSLLPGLLQALMGNLNRQHRQVRLYESGVVFKGTISKRKEQSKIAGVATGSVYGTHWDTSNRDVDFFDIKGDVESLLHLGRDNSTHQLNSSDIKFAADNETDSMLHPGQSASLIQNKKKVGLIGKLHPQIISILDIDQPVFVFEIDISVIKNAHLPKFQAISRFPETRRDLSVLVDETTPVGDVSSVIEDSAGSLLVKLELFDIYRGEGIESTRKSLSFGLTLKESSRTLVEAEVDGIIDKVLSALESKVGGTLRT